MLAAANIAGHLAPFANLETHFFLSAFRLTRKKVGREETRVFFYPLVLVLLCRMRQVSPKIFSNHIPPEPLILRFFFFFFSLFASEAATHFDTGLARGGRTEPTPYYDMPLLLPTNLAYVNARLSYSV